MSLASADVGAQFCSYCGRPPIDGSQERANRVCPRCKMGVVLQARRVGAPSHRDSFLIIDEDLIVRALSRRAEVLLAVDEPAGVDIPLNRFLICDNGDSDGVELAWLIGLALALTPSFTFSLRSRKDPPVRLDARITSCGPPPAAVLILTPTADDGSTVLGNVTTHVSHSR